MLAQVNSGHRRDVLLVLNQSSGLSGADVRRELEARDHGPVTPPVVYQGLERLVEMGLVAVDEGVGEYRANEYQVTEDAVAGLAVDWRIQ